MRNKDLSVKIIMLMFSLMRQIRADEHTKKSNKLAMQMKKYLRKLYMLAPDYHDKLAHEAEAVWSSAKSEILADVDKNDFVVSMRGTLMALYGLLEHSGIPKLAFTERTFVAALNSIEANGYTNTEKTDLEVETMSNQLIDLFAKHLHIKQDNKLKLMKARVAGNLLLSGKLGEEWT